MIYYAATTEGITVRVRPIYLDQQSDFFSRRFVFTSHIAIENKNAAEIRLLRRRWRIHEASGYVQQIEGEGVAGEQPIIPVGGTHYYSSYCVLSSFQGSIYGTYLIECSSGTHLRIAIPRFKLAARAN